MKFFAMSKTVIKNLFRKPVTVQYPFAPREYHPCSRGSISIDITQCIFCGICMRKCPTAALVVNKTEKTWQINRLGCISCGCCRDVCPKKCLTMKNTYSPVTKVREKEIYRNA